MTTWVEWDEPLLETGRRGEAIGGIVRVKKDDAIRWQMLRTDIYNKALDPEQAALEDFMATRWAWLKEYEE